MRAHSDIRFRKRLPWLVSFFLLAVPPGKPVIKYVSKLTVEESVASVIGPFNEGDRLVLLCEVIGGGFRGRPAFYGTNVLSRQQRVRLDPDVRGISCYFFFKTNICYSDKQKCNLFEYQVKHFLFNLEFRCVGQRSHVFNLLYSRSPARGSFKHVNECRNTIKDILKRC